MKDCEEIISTEQAVRIQNELMACIIYQMFLSKNISRGQAEEWGKHLKNVHDYLENNDESKT